MIVRIKKGHHYRSNRLLTAWKIGFTWSRTYEVTFDNSCRYTLEENKTQVNKLLGVGQLHHHFNSIRVGWRWSELYNAVSLLVYSYRNGQRLYFWAKDVAVGEKIPITVDYTVKEKNAAYRLQIGNIVSSFNWKIEHWWQRFPLLYECFPYFGGSQPAPQQININIIKTKTK